MPKQLIKIIIIIIWHLMKNGICDFSDDVFSFSFANNSATISILHVITNIDDLNYYKTILLDVYLR